MERIVSHMAKKELQRTCRRDGTVWYVSATAIKKMPKRRLERFSANSAALGSRLSPSGKRPAGELRLMNLRMQDQQIADQLYRQTHCPTCGSTAFTEKKVRV